MCQLHHPKRRMVKYRKHLIKWKKRRDRIWNSPLSKQGGKLKNINHSIITNKSNITVSKSEKKDHLFNFLKFTIIVSRSSPKRKISMLGQLLMFWHSEKNPRSELGDCDKDFHESCQISVTDNENVPFHGWSHPFD